MYEKVIKYNFMFVYAYQHTTDKCICGNNDNFAANSSVNADQIGWYQVRPSTEVSLLDYNKYDCGSYLYAPTDLAPTQTQYRYSDRIWVDAPSSGGQKASANPDVVIQGRFLITTEPYTGSRAYVDSFFFRPIKDLKDTDIADYNQYYGN